MEYIDCYNTQINEVSQSAKPTEVVVHKSTDLFFCIEKEHLSKIYPGIEDHSPHFGLGKREITHGGLESNRINFILWNSSLGKIKLLDIEKAKLLVREVLDSKPHRVTFLSKKNTPELFKKVLDRIKFPMSIEGNVVGVLDTNTLKSNQLEAILINELCLKVPRNYLIPLRDSVARLDSLYNVLRDEFIEQNGGSLDNKPSNYFAQKMFNDYLNSRDLNKAARKRPRLDNPEINSGSSDSK